MRIFRSHRPSPALVVSIIALVVALGGTSYAALSLPKNSVGANQLKSGAVTAAKIKNGAVTGSKVANGTLTGANIKLSTLGTVPSAASATSAISASNATNAINATIAANATTAAKLGQVFYRSTPFTVAAAGSVDVRSTAHAACGAGTFAVGGGTTSSDESLPLSDYLIDSHPTAGGTGWEVTVENENSTAANETVWAVCVPASSIG